MTGVNGIFIVDSPEPALLAKVAPAAGPNTVEINLVSTETRNSESDKPLA